MILTIPPKKLWRGKKRLCKPMLCGDSKILNWALQVKVGDYIGTCLGHNRQVAKIEYLWQNEGLWRRFKKNRSWFLEEVIFQDTTGGSHACPGGGCAFPPEPVEKILRYYTENWPLVSPPKLNEQGDLVFTSEEYQAWREEFRTKYPSIF